MNNSAHSIVRLFDHSKTSPSHSIIRLFDYSKTSHSSPAFTLVEMLVVIGIIAVLIAALIGSFSAVRNAAEKARTQELVANTATALTALFNDKGVWPRQLREGNKKGILDEETAYPLVSGSKYMSLTADSGSQKLSGLDRFGIVTPQASAVIKRLGVSSSKSSKLPNGTTIEDNILHYALDLDGDGVIESVNVGGETVDIRATAVVWCIGKTGGNKGKPWAYTEGLKKDDVYSWSYGQTRNVK